MLSAPTSLSLPALLGIPAGAGCLLGPEQIRQVGAHILRCRPNDPHARALAGGPLSDLAGATPWRGGLADTPFLVITGEQGALALLCRPEGAQHRCTILSDPDRVDQAAMALAQLGDDSYSLSALAAAEPQRAFVAAVAAALAGDPRLSRVDWAALLPDEQRWLSLAGALALCADPVALLAAPDLRQLLREQRVERVILGQLEAGSQLRRLAATEAGAPALIELQPGVLSGVIQSRRPGSVPAGAPSGLSAAGAAWLGGDSLTVVPLLREGATWGLLLAASPRPLSGAARATLHGVGALLAANIRSAPAEAPQPVPAPARPPTPAAAPARPDPLAPRVAQRRPATLARDMAALLGRLADAALLVDGQGRLVAYSPAAAQLLALSGDARGRTLVESGAACLVPLLSEALMGEEAAEDEIELPRGARARASVSGLDGALWAFVLEGPAAPAAPAPAISESERNESFLANFSNIIRVPLRELRNLITSVPAAGELNEQQSRLIGQVVRLNSELTMLVNDLLALGQIRLQASEYRAPLRLDLLIEAAVSTQYAEFGRRGQHVTTDLAPGLPRVVGSEEGLGRAVAALIDNAIKYSPSGAQIHVAARREGASILVSVADSGPGLSEAERAQVFDPFYRAEGAERAGVSGRGLGLTIAKAVIEQHDGQIWVSGEPGRGCVFAFRLPCDASA